MKIAIAIPHGHTPKWLQTVMYSLKRWENIYGDARDIFIGCTWPDHPSIRAVTETSLGENVRIINCKSRLHSHATALEHVLEAIWDDGYDYLFACETDCQAMQDHWLDWYVSHMTHPSIGMAGFFWEEGKNHYNINPSGTLYRMDMLKKYHEEARANKSGMFYHPRGNKADTEPGMDPSIKEVVGCFAETRGIQNPTDEQTGHILNGVPQAAWFEPGQWLFIRSLGEWGNVRVHCDHVYINTGKVHTPEATYYGGKANPQFIHWWGGTRAYDFLKHPVSCDFVKGGAPWWIAREDRIWRESVPEDIRAIVPNLIAEAQTEQKMRENLGFIIPEAL